MLLATVLFASMMTTGLTSKANAAVVLPFVQVSAGGFHTCAVRSDNTLWCWGKSISGDTHQPQNVLSKVTYVAVGGDHVCALRIDKTVWCWGKGSLNRLGRQSKNIPNQDDSAIPIKVQSLSNVISLSSGSAHSCVSRTDFSVWCWGWNSSGQLGTPYTGGGGVASSLPIKVVGLPEVDKVEVGAFYSCAITRKSAVWCWGAMEKRLGQDMAFQPKNLSISSAIGIGLAASGYLTDNIVAEPWTDYRGRHTCAVTSSFRIYCWGSNRDGELGIGPNSGSNSQRQTPTLLSSSLRAKKIDVGAGHSCAVSIQDKAWCWGLNYRGQVGNSKTGKSVLAPVQVALGVSIKGISAGGYHTCAVSMSGEIWCWGANDHGQVGVWNQVLLRLDVPTPTRVVFN